MPDIELSERAEEILADLWVRREEQKEGPPLAGEDIEAALRELAAAGLIDEGTGQVSLTEEGDREAAGIVRRERLAERLLVDVVNLGEPAATEAACKFETRSVRFSGTRRCVRMGAPFRPASAAAPARARRARSSPRCATWHPDRAASSPTSTVAGRQ